MGSIKSQGILPLQCGYEDKVQTLKKTACPRVEGPKNKNKKLSRDLLETQPREQKAKCAT